VRHHSGASESQLSLQRRWKQRSCLCFRCLWRFHGKTVQHGSPGLRVVAGILSRYLSYYRSSIEPSVRSTADFDCIDSLEAFKPIFPIYYAISIYRMGDTRYKIYIYCTYTRTLILGVASRRSSRVVASSGLLNQFDTSCTLTGTVRSTAVKIGGSEKSPAQKHGAVCAYRLAKIRIARASRVAF